MTTALHSLESSGIGRALRESLWAYPAVETIHIIGLAALFGSVLVVDLRLLGIGRAIPVTRLARLALPVTVGAFLLVVVSGTLLFTAHAAEFLENRVFVIKLLLIVAAGANAGILHSGPLTNVAAWDTAVMPPPQVRAAAALSLLLWPAVIACGRLLAYT